MNKSNLQFFQFSLDFHICSIINVDCTSQCGDQIISVQWYLFLLLLSHLSTSFMDSLIGSETSLDVVSIIPLLLVKMMVSVLELILVVMLCLTYYYFCFWNRLLLLLSQSITQYHNSFYFISGLQFNCIGQQFQDSLHWLQPGNFWCLLAYTN